MVNRIKPAFCIAAVIAATMAMSANTSGFASSRPSECDGIKPALKKESSTTKAVVNAENYACAETEIILGDYVQKIAKATCSDGMDGRVHAFPKGNGSKR